MTFDEWFNETEVFNTRADRFYDDLITYKLECIEAEHLVKWLKWAYKTGYEHRDKELMDDGK